MGELMQNRCAVVILHYAVDGIEGPGKLCVGSECI